MLSKFANMTDELKEVLTTLETTLRESEKPDYIELTYNLNMIYILLSKKEYKDMIMYDRIQRVSAVLEFEHEEIMEKYPVVIETYDSDQLKALFDSYKK